MAETRTLMGEAMKLLVVLLVYGAASLLHHVHNAEYLHDYPNMPAWLSPAQVYGAWLATIAVGLVGYVLLRRGRQLGWAFLALYGIAGLYGLVHYWLAPASSHTAMMNLTIWLEAATAILVLSAVLRASTREAR